MNRSISSTLPLLQRASNRLFLQNGYKGTSALLGNGVQFRQFASATAAYDQSIKSQDSSYFPSLIIGDKIEAQGSFAEAQAVYLDPDPESVQQLEQALIDSKMGVVAHYYMDVELQGVLQAVRAKLPNRVGIADSLKMGDMAVEMVSQEGPSGQDADPATAIACLGVDFMSESVQAILAKNGYPEIPVYRAAAEKIGCSLAESAERDTYRAWLQKETSGNHPALHVVYINTSLETKAVSSSLVPTITCTSSNVLKTILTTWAQLKRPDLKILYGPDTYMGNNLVTLLTAVLDSGWDDEKIARDLHPEHNRETVAQLRDAISVFPSGNCIVHHMFGESVVNAVREHYDDCYVTAHLEVPGEMFQIAMEKSLEGKGVVGATSDILSFVTQKVQAAAAEGSSAEKKRLRFILGTEAGMVTSIVQNVKEIIKETGNDSVQAEIIFPVAQDAVMATDENSGEDGMALVPGVGGGEGCSTAGGCATCPFMKMNDLDALLNVLKMSKDTDVKLQQHLPPDRLSGKSIGGRLAMDLGTEAILYMRAFMQNGQLPPELVQKILKQAS